MINKPELSVLIDYLYGELDEIRSKEVEAYLATDPELVKELEALSFTKKVLKKTQDKDIEPPITLSDLSPGADTQFLKNRFVQACLSLAASILILMLVGAAVKINLKVSGEGWQIGFNEQAKTLTTEAKSPEEPPITKDIDGIVDHLSDPKEDKASVDIKKQMDQMMLNHQNINTQIALLNQKLNTLGHTPTASITKEELQDLLELYKKENLETMLKVVTLANEEQKQYMAGLLTNYAEYDEQKRVSDLSTIETNIQASAQKQLETQQVLSQLITRVNDQKAKR